jgi:hypothetical protein
MEQPSILRAARRIIASHPHFVAPVELRVKIAGHLAETWQVPVGNPAKLVATIGNSISVCCADNLALFEGLPGRSESTRHVIDSGSQKRLLNRSTLNRTGGQFFVGQLKRLPSQVSCKSKIIWVLSGDLGQLRKVVQESEFGLEVFTPKQVAL